MLYGVKSDIAQSALGTMIHVRVCSSVGRGLAVKALNAAVCCD